MINNSKSYSAKRVLITGGAGFIGGCFIKRLLKETEFEIFNLDKMSYCSNHDMNFDSPHQERPSADRHVGDHEYQTSRLEFHQKKGRRA